MVRRPAHPACNEAKATAVVKEKEPKDQNRTDDAASAISPDVESDGANSSPRQELQPGAVWVGPSVPVFGDVDELAPHPPVTLRRSEARTYGDTVAPREIVLSGRLAEGCGEAEESAPGRSAHSRSVCPTLPVVDGVPDPLDASAADGKEARCLEERCGARLLHFILPMAAVVAAVVGIGVGIGIAASRGRYASEAPSGLSSGHSERYLALRDVIYGGVVLPAALNEPTSPQSLALKWLADVDPAMLDPSGADGAARLGQRHALVTLYYATNDGKGENGTAWGNGCNFLTGGHECSWNKDGLGAFCGEGMEVVSTLDLRANNLFGTLPEEAFWLSHVEKVVFGMNQLYGPIPSSIGNLKKLTFLDMWINELSGTIPTQISLLSELRVLWLGTNELTGTMPDIRSLTQLRALALSTNSLTGTIPESVGDLVDLEILGLHTNSLSGHIPTSIASLPRLQQLYMNSNDFLDEFLPLFPGAFPSLRALICWKCNLTGTIPTAIGSLSKLEQLSLFGNHLRGMLPESALESLTKLSLINVENNELSGSVPGGIGGSFGSIRHLSLGKNRLEGALPTGLLLRNPHLSVLTLEENRLTGTIPSVVGEMDKLWLLDLRSNYLEGSIPAALGKSKELRYLDLSDNRLNGTVPKSFQDLDRLDWLSLSRNDLSGDISFLCNFSEKLQLFADCEEVHCPCCTICCEGKKDGGCDQILPTFTILRNLCYQILVPQLLERSEDYSELVCPADSYLDQLAHNNENEKKDGGVGSRRGLRKQRREKGALHWLANMH